MSGLSAQSVVRSRQCRRRSPPPQWEARRPLPLAALPARCLVFDPLVLLEQQWGRQGVSPQGLQELQKQQVNPEPVQRPPLPRLPQGVLSQGVLLGLQLSPQGLLLGLQLSPQGLLLSPQVAPWTK